MIDETIITEEMPEDAVKGNAINDTVAADVTDASEESTNGESSPVDTDNAVTDTEDRIEELCKRQSIDAEYLEFARLFPGVNIATLPDTVCNSVRSGIPLAAAYALYEKERSFESSRAGETNTKNAAMSFRLKENSSEKYFSPDEVKSMSREEVRTNYKRIIESMRHWR